MSFTCIEVAKAAGLTEGARSGQEQLYICPRHNDRHPSLSINTTKDVFMCGPCGAQGTAWQLVAFLNGVDPSDKPAVYRRLQEYGLFASNNDVAKEEHESTLKKIIQTY